MFTIFDRKCSDRSFSGERRDVARNLVR